MGECRADHAVIFFKGQIYVFGGMSHSKTRKEPFIESKNSVEVYNIEKDSWTELKSFSKARQEFTVTHFNDRYMFIFGGKVLKP
jgi:N-acetylneuraminic acid mutarotase